MKVENTRYTVEQMKNIVDYYDSRKTNKLGQTTKRYSSVTNYATVKRFRSYVEANGTNLHKFKRLQQHVMERFSIARSNLVHVSEDDLKRWGSIKARELGLPFHASPKWLHVFKIKNRIVSRKITKYMTTREHENLSNVEEQAKSFVKDFKQACANISPSRIFNFDQPGFNYEYSPKRTLSNRGERETIG